LGTPELFESGYSALMFLDLDGFKQINDTIGHDAGDQLLVETASRLRKTLRDTDSVYRFGGDEFVVLLSYVHDRRGAAVVANNILGEIRRPVELNVSDQTLATASVGVSIGIAMIPDDGKTIAAATKSADLAMYSAKEGGRNNYTFYNRTLDARAHSRWKLEQGIRTSLENQEFEMHYQPLLDEHGRLCGLEGLLRWQSSSHGYIPPDTFMPVAEDTGMIVPLGGWAIETAFRDALKWQPVDGNAPFISVNLSPKQFDRSDLLESIGRVINQTGIDPQRVILELTESCIMTAPERSIATLQALKDRYPGLQIAIDDFGTGYSSLSYLSRIPSDIIKIDISFVSNLFELNNEKIVRSIINLGHSLGLRIIAEGVETAEQFAYFADKKCFALQGFYFHRPMPADEVAALIR
ncbi:MAG: putative bifunctional diguanylate cyclase/phosphodiesterase, partial [Spirochaetota bacterium]